MNSLSLKLSQVMSVCCPKNNSPANCIYVITAGRFNTPALKLATAFCDVDDVNELAVPERNVALPCCVLLNDAEVDDVPVLCLVGETEMPKLDVIEAEAKSNFCAAADTLKLANIVEAMKSLVPSAEIVNDEDNSNPSKK